MFMVQAMNTVLKSLAIMTKAISNTITLKEFPIDYDIDGKPNRIEICICRNNLKLICPDKIRPCSDRCPFCHIEKTKVTLTCRTNVEHFYF